MKRNKPLRGRTASAIAASAEAAIHSGSLRSGDPLPTVRSLARALRVSPTTVAASYRVLHARGLVVGRGRRGTHVAPRQPTLAPRAGLRLASGTVDLATGNPDPDLLPPLDPLLRAIDTRPRLYDAPSILPALAAFVRGELAADGIPAAPLTMAGGGLDGIDRVLREHATVGDRVGVEDPAFPGLLDLISGHGFAPVPVAMDDEGPVPHSVEAALAARIRALIVTPRAQNPTGAALSPPRAAALRDLLSAHPNLLLIEDDYAGPTAGAEAMTLCDPARPHWAVVRSVSKFLGPDLRLAFVTGDPVTVARVGGRLALGARWVSHILQQLVLGLWSDPANGRRLARAADIYRLRRESLLAALSSRGVPARGASGMHVWVPLREETPVVQGLLERGWAVMPGERFRLKAAPGIRVTTAALAPADAQRFATDLAEVLARPGGAVA